MFLIGDENKKMLLELSAVESLLHLMQSEDVNVRRHSTMAMGIMCQHGALCYFWDIYIQLALLIIIWILS